MMVLYLNSIDLKALEENLALQINKTPQLFKGVPFVVDLSAIPEGNNIDLNWLKNLLLAKDVVPAGLRNANKDLEAKAQSAGWAILADVAGKSKGFLEKKPKVQEAIVETPKPEAITVIEEVEVAVETTVHVQQVRSGQQLSVVSGDLVVVNSVNEGAELLVDGNIHIYGALRGRALAGIHGNRSVRIFCQSLEAELVSIAGFYRMEEDLPETLLGKAVQIYLEGDDLKIEALIK